MVSSHHSPRRGLPFWRTGPQPEVPVKSVRRTHVARSDGTYGNLISLKFHRVPGTGAWLIGSCASSFFNFNPDLVRSELQRRFRIPFFARETQCTVCGQLVDRFCNLAAVCPCAGDRDRRHNAVAQVFYDAAQEAGLHAQRKMCLLQQAPVTDEPRPHRRRVEEDSTPEGLASRILGQCTASTRNLTEYETLKRTFHETAGC